MTLYTCSVTQLRRAIAREIESGPHNLSVSAWTARGALELLGQGTMGHSFDSLVDPTINDYTVVVKSLMYVIPLAHPPL